jgi:hypothetical protein
MEERLGWGWKQATGRAPQPEEIRLLSQLVEKHRAQFSVETKAHEALLKVGFAAQPDGLQPSEVAAYASAARALLNLHEVVTRP